MERQVVIAVGKENMLSVLRIRIRRIHKFLGLPEPCVRGMDPDSDPGPSIIKQK